MKLNLESNTFRNNKAINGGALYLSNDLNPNKNRNQKKNEEEKEKQNIEKLILNNNVFVGNSAEKFGGAIYANYNKLYLATSTNNIVRFNTAKIMGGGIYVPHSIKTNLFPIVEGEWTINNNTVYASPDNYSSKPAFLILLNSAIPKSEMNITSGEFFPLTFLLQDEFNKTVTDITRYYSSLLLKLTLIKKSRDNDDTTGDNNNNNSYMDNKRKRPQPWGNNNKYYDEEKKEDENDKDNDKFYVTGNIGTFFNGRCELNKLRIYANPGTYAFLLQVENYNDGLLLSDFNHTEINISQCKRDQIKMNYNPYITYCETPLCRLDCPVGKSALCKPDENSHGLNDREKNHCICLSGWEGDNCSKKIYTNYR